MLVHDPRQDRPIRDEHFDQLDRGPFVDNLVRTLVRDQLDEDGKLIARRATGYVVGLTGRWGLGKSSVLNLLSLKLGSMDRVLVAEFNPWLLKGPDELLTGFFNAMRSALGNNTSEEIRALREAIDRYWAAINFAGHGIAALADIHGAAGSATAFWNRFGTKAQKAIAAKPPTPDDERKSLENKISNSKCAVVMLIDELDRVEDEEVRSVARLVKAVGDIKGISYLVAYDPDRVVDALGRGSDEDRKKTGSRYLEKIIQHPIPLRPLFTDDTRALLDAALSQHDAKLSQDTTPGESKILDYLVSVIETPREVKRLIGAYVILESAVRGEISQLDVLGYSWILTKSPSARDLIAANVDEVVDDPNEAGMIARISRRLDKSDDSTPVIVLGSAAESQSEMLRLLFPRFSKDKDRGAGDRLSRRRNLVRLLYLGNPPGAFSRADIERIWSETDATKLEAELRQLYVTGKLSSALDRIDDLLHSLPSCNDNVFWPALARIFFRQTDWLDGPQTSRDLAEDASAALFHLARRDLKQVDRVRRILDALIENEDLIIAPGILRKELFAHGLTNHPEGPRGEGIFEIEYVKNLIDCEIPRYTNAVRNGIALKRLPNMEAIFTILNVSSWDDLLRDQFTGQLESAEAISTFAGLLVPPGYSTDRATVNLLANAEVLHDNLREAIPPDEPLNNQWLNESVNRLRRILAGRDPHADDDR